MIKFVNIISEMIIAIAMIISFLSEYTFAQEKNITDKRLDVYLINREILKANKEKIKADDKDLADPYKKLRRMAELALNEGPFSVTFKKQLPPSGDKHDYMSLGPYWWPDPSKPDGLPYIRRDGEVNPVIYEYTDKQQLVQMSLSVKLTALAYFLTDDEKYAEYAANILRIWFVDCETKMNPNFNYGQAVPGIADGRPVGIIEARHFTDIIDAIGLIKASKYWDEQTDMKIKDWFEKYFTWVTCGALGKAEAQAPNNHGSWYDVQVASIALFLGKTETAQSIIEDAKLKRIGNHIENDGRQPNELARTRSLSYSAFNLEALFSLAELGNQVNVDLWNYTSPGGASLKKAFDFLLPYFFREKEWPYDQIRTFDYERINVLLLQAANNFSGEEYNSLADKPDDSYSDDINKILYKR